MLISGCNRKQQIPDIRKVKVDLKFYRFEQDLFNLDYEKISDSIQFIKNKYGEFFDIFNYKIIKIGDYEKSFLPRTIKSFYNRL